MDLFSTSPIEAYSLVRSCINCTMPANLLATFTLIAMGAGLVTYVERRKAILLNCIPGKARLGLHAERFASSRRS